MMPKSLRLLFCLISIFHPLVLLAQQSISLNVRDISDHSLVANESIVLENKVLGQQRTLVTDEYGQVVFQLHIDGQYQIFLASSSNYISFDTLYIQLGTLENTKIEFFVYPKTYNLPEVVLNSDKYSVVNLSILQATVSSKLPESELRQLPVEGRDISKALYRLPNVSQATGFYAEAPSISINGANGLFTNYQIDGLDNNENFLGGMRFKMPLGFVKSIEVLTNNFSVEYGLSANGIVNLSSKSGKNQSQAEAYYLVRPGKLTDAVSPFAQRDLTGNLVKEGFQRHQFGASVGGALRPSKTFYFINVEQTFDKKENLLSSPELGLYKTINGQNAMTYASLKLDNFWNENWHSSLRFNLGQVEIGKPGGGLSGGVLFPSAGGKQLQNSWTLASKNEFVKGKFSSQSNVLLAKNNWDYYAPNNSDQPTVDVFYGGVQLATIGNPGGVFDENETTYLIQQKFAWQKGKHRLKIGGEIKSSHFELFGGANSKGRYQVALSAEQFGQLQNDPNLKNLDVQDLPSSVEVTDYKVELRPASITGHQQIYSLYLEDILQVHEKLNLSLGIRYDYDNLSKGAAEKGDMNNLAPRFSFNYRINEKTSIKGGYGLFYDKITYAIYSDARQFSSNHSHYKVQLQALKTMGILPENAEIDHLVFEGNRNVSANLPIQYLQGREVNAPESARNESIYDELRILNPNGYSNPYALQSTIGIQHKPSKKHLFYADVVYNESFDLLRLRNLNAAVKYPIDPDKVILRSSDEANLSRPIPIYSDGRALVNDSFWTGMAKNVMMTESAGRATYIALSVTLNKDKADDNFSYRLNYTLSRLENNTEDINFRAMDGNDFGNEWGSSINDRTHLINGIFTYFLQKNFSVTLAGLLQSGQPINRIPDPTVFGTSDLNGDGRFFSDAYAGNNDRHPGESRNNDRLPWSTTFDLALQYDLPLGKRQKLGLSMNVFNLFNAVNMSGYANNATQSNQIQVGSKASGIYQRKNAAPPRQFQFGLTWRFQ